MITDEPDHARIDEIIAKVESLLRHLDLVGQKCHVQIPVEEEHDYYTFERQRGALGDRYWLFNLENESLVYDEVEDRIIRDVLI